MQLASPNYHDNAGTPDPSDDIDRRGLEAFLKTRLHSATETRYEMHYNAIDRDGSHTRVSYTFVASFRVAGVKKLVRRVDDNVLDLVQGPGGFSIVSGM